MINACTFITRRCTRNCLYCDACNVKGEDELDWLDWIHVNDILHRIGVDFNLIIGNESWLLGSKLNKIMELSHVPFAMYTTAPPHLFNRHKKEFFSEGGHIDNFSCAIDYSISHLQNHSRNDMEIKSAHGWIALREIKEKYPHVDCQGQITVHKKNFQQVPEIVLYLSSMGVHVGINFIHWNKDGKFDFFPNYEDLKDLIFTEEDIKDIRDMFRITLNVRGIMIQNKELLNPSLVPKLIKTEWHCRGNPYGGPTIDSDGSLRCCGYRKGEKASQYTVFELPKHFKSYLKAVHEDAMECPGCFWSYPYLYKYWENTDPSFARTAFIKHARPDIPEELWGKRKIQ